MHPIDILINSGKSHTLFLKLDKEIQESTLVYGTLLMKFSRVEIQESTLVYGTLLTKFSRVDLKDIFEGNLEENELVYSTYDGIMTVQKKIGKEETYSSPIAFQKDEDFIKPIAVIIKYFKRTKKLKKNHKTFLEFYRMTFPEGLFKNLIQELLRIRVNVNKMRYISRVY
jgi:hypothetical protein